jgi:hypothetical protein
VSDPVTSPTFSIGHRYRGRGVTVSHLDLYRLASLGGEDPGLLADYVGDGRIAFVEWPASASGELASARLCVTLTHRGGDRRRIEVDEWVGREVDERGRGLGERAQRDLGERAQRGLDERAERGLGERAERGLDAPAGIEVDGPA